MTGGRGLAALLLATNLGLPFGLHWPTWVERWLYNPGERTAQGIAAYAAKHYDQATPRFESALRLAPADARTAYNAGTGELAAGKAQDAAKLLSKAAAGAPPELAPDATYNLGTARLAAGDAAGAIDALEQSLRARPDFPDAKHNLELALGALERQQKPRAKPPQGGPQADRRDDEQSSQRPGTDEPSRGEPKPSPAADPGDAGERQQPGKEGRRPLPRFKDQPDMSAEQAAAILRAVENLERQQRRADALARAKENASEESDW